MVALSTAKSRYKITGGLGACLPNGKALTSDD